MEEKSKMVYNASKGKEEEQKVLAGMATKGVITLVEDGRVKDFIKSPEGLKAYSNNTDDLAINVNIEVLYENDKYMVSKMFMYHNDSDGNVAFGPNSHLGKYNSYYRKLPDVGDEVNLLSDKNGFFKLIIE